MPVSRRVTVTQQFSDDFELVATRYNLRELGEYELARNAARNDLDSAIACFAALADEVRNEYGTR
jgi:hypothetical protein